MPSHQHRSILIDSRCHHESSLHKALKAHYAGKKAKTEVGWEVYHRYGRSRAVD